MKFLKYLILGFIFSVLPACTTAQEVKESDQTWSVGDKVASFYICRTEEDIMEIAIADSKGKELLRESVLIKSINKDCLNLNPPLSFMVKEILGSYKDHTKKETSILAISIPNKEEIAGYIIAIGKPKMDKGI